MSGDGEGFLLIDDFVDTGVNDLKQSPWIFFPWDIDYRLAKPIHDGGRAAREPWSDQQRQAADTPLAPTHKTA